MRIRDWSSYVCSSDLLAGDIDAGFVRKAHAGRELCRFAAHEVDRLVPVEPDPVTGAMRGAGQLVARAPPEAFIIGAHRIVDLACRGAEFRCGKGDILPLAHLVPHLPDRKSTRLNSSH